MKSIYKENKKTLCVLYVSDCVPPIATGPSILIHRLLRCFPDGSYMFLTRSFKGRLEEEVDEGLQLSGRYFYVLNNSLWRFFPKLQSSQSKWKWLQVPFIFWRGMQVLRGKSVKHLLVAPFAHWGTFLLATCLLHCISGTPMSIYFFDIFDRGRRDNWENRVRSLIERMAISMASHVFVMSEPLQEHYREKYGIKSILLPHPIDLSFYNSSCNVEKGELKQSGELLKIVFTGMIYESQLDAILNLVNVVNELPNVELHIYTPRTEPKLRWMGISGHHVIFHGRVSHKEIPAIQQNADILFLPMAFNSVYPHMIKKIPSRKLREDLAAERQVIKTASPSKLPEYLAAGRPILIHAPSYSYVAWYGKTHQCAEVVDNQDLEALRSAVLRLWNDKNYCDLLVTNARKAVEQHDFAKVSKKLQQCLGIATLEPIEDRVHDSSTDVEIRT